MKILSYLFSTFQTAKYVSSLGGKSVSSDMFANIEVINFIKETDRLLLAQVEILNT